MPKTQENLATAFAGESQANRKYLAFARQAEKEGYAQIARLFVNHTQCPEGIAIGRDERRARVEPYLRVGSH